MFRVLAVIAGLTLLILARCHYADIAKKVGETKGTGPSYETQWSMIGSYFQSGGQEADSMIRHVVGNCFEREAARRLSSKLKQRESAGKLPYEFRQLMSGAFIFALRETGGTVPTGNEPREHMATYVGNHHSEYSSMVNKRPDGDSLSREEFAMIQRARSLWYYSNEVITECVHRQLEGRGLLAQPEN